MIYGSVCSGIEAASVAWEPLGWKPAFFSEIEAFPRAVLGHHHPAVPLHGDFTTINEGEYDPIDLLVGGTPCQSFSVAGKRLGLDDPRGNLSIEYLRMARRLRPRWLVWENVPGVLSSGGGRDFGAFLGLLGELGYGWAYRILDAQFFGVPQRRRRVFVVGHSSGDWRRAAAVLFEPESLRRDTPPRREKGEDLAPTISARPSGGGGLGTDFDLDGGLATVSAPAPDWPAQTAPTLNAHYGDKWGLEDQHALNGAGLYVPTAIAFSSKDSGADASAVATPLRAMNHHGSHANGGGQVAIAIQERAVSDNPAAGPQGKGYQEGVAYTLEARNKVQAVAFNSREDPDSWSDRTGPLGSSLPQAQAIAFDMRGREGGAMPEGPHDTAAIRAASGGSSRSYLAFKASYFTRGKDGAPSEIAAPLSADADRGDQDQLVMGQYAVRRLTPIECERLQGFPDNYTAIPWRGKPADQCPDGPRYKALGNSMAVPVMRWIGERIEAMEKAL